jgi:hypothetical protein
VAPFTKPAPLPLFHPLYTHSQVYHCFESGFNLSLTYYDYTAAAAVWETPINPITPLAPYILLLALHLAFPPSFSHSSAGHHYVKSECGIRGAYRLVRPNVHCKNFAGFSKIISQFKRHLNDGLLS